MTAKTLEGLPLDVCDRLLCTLPNFATLQALVLSCRALHDIYVIRKKSVFDEVVKNEVGPALRYAVAVARGVQALNGLNATRPQVYMWFQRTEWDGLRVGIEGENGREGDYWNSEIQLADVRACEHSRIVSTADAVETEFSLRYKDRTRTDRSSLTSNESERFRRALYLNWVLAILSFGGNGLDPLEFLERFLENPSVSGKEAVSFLFRLSNQELCEFFQVRKFLLELVQHTSPYHDNIISPTIVKELIPPALPSDVIAGFRGKYYLESYTLPNHPERFSRGLGILYRSRNVEELLAKSLKGQAILDASAEGHIAACENCHTPDGWLYNNTCWSRLDEILPTRWFDHLLPGRLQQNRLVRNMLVGDEGYCREPDFYSKLIFEMIRLRTDSAHGWDAERWICRSCYVELLKQGLVGWLLARQIKDGYEIKPNCEYGYNCRTQTHNQDHAVNFNHLCEPDSSKDDTQ